MMAALNLRIDRLEAHSSIRHGGRDLMLGLRTRGGGVPAICYVEVAVRVQAIGAIEVFILRIRLLCAAIETGVRATTDPSSAGPTPHPIIGFGNFSCAEQDHKPRKGACEPPQPLPHWGQATGRASTFTQPVHLFASFVASTPAARCRYGTESPQGSFVVFFASTCPSISTL